MKQLLFTLMLFVIVLSPLAAACQALPDAPAPQATAPPAPDPAWMRVEQLANGEHIVVTSDYGPPTHCRFAGATDDYLFCDPPGNPEGTGYRFDRARVIQVDVDRVSAPPHEHNGHPGVLVAMAITGTVVGLLGASGGDARTGLLFGLAGAGFAGAVGTIGSAINGNFVRAGPSIRVHRVGRWHRTSARARVLLPAQR